LRRPRAASLPVIRYFYLAHFVQCSARRPWVIRRHRSVLQCPLMAQSGRTCPITPGPS
jgi:hypothetical protein